VEISNLAITSFKEWLSSPPPDLIQEATESNPWFNEFNIRYAIQAFSDWMETSALEEFWKRGKDLSPQKIIWILAGNIPGAGFHDLLSAIATPGESILKLSHQDFPLINALALKIFEINPSAQKRVSLTSTLPNDVDLVIGSGSDLTSRLLSEVWPYQPKLLRGNRFSIAVLEEIQDYKALAFDILLYNGLGCRNVSHIISFLPNPPDSFLQALLNWPQDNLSKSYQEKLKWEKACQQVYPKSFSLPDSLPIVIQPATTIRPCETGTLQWVKVNSVSEREAILKEASPQIQIIVGRDCKEGRSQHPGLWDYADQIDPVEWIRTSMLDKN
jgi:hypothetical protein